MTKAVAKKFKAPAIITTSESNDWEKFVTPTENRVIIKPDISDEEQKYKDSSLIIPDSFKEKPTKGTILAVGAGEYQRGVKIPMLTKPGDRVLYGKNLGTPYKINDTEVIILREGDILCVFHSE